MFLLGLSLAPVLVLGVFGLLFWMMDATVYSPGYSERAFKKIQSGMTKAEVERLVGAPLRIHHGYPGVTRWYGPPGSSVRPDGALVCPSQDWSNLAIIEFDPTGQFTMQNPWARKTPDEIATVLGEPIKERNNAAECWEYTDGNCYRRSVRYDQSGKVGEVVAYFNWD